MNSKKKVRRLSAPRQMPAAPPPKVFTRSLVELAQEANLEGEDLQKFVAAQQDAMQKLQVHNVKKSAHSFALERIELDAILGEFDDRSDKAELTVSIITRAAVAGMTEAQQGVFAMKLARMGLHK